MGDADVILYAFWIDPLKIQSSDFEASDVFGISVSISGDGTTAIVGAYGYDDNGLIPVLFTSIINFKQVV